MPSPHHALSDSQWSQLEAVVQQLEEGWQSGTEPDLQALLGTVDPAIRPKATIECVKIDMEYRWRSGHHVHIEEYLKRWPEELDHDTTIRELLESECSTRALFSSLPTEAEIRARFPVEAGQIDLPVIAEAARADREYLVPDPETSREELADSMPVEANSDPPVILLGQQLGRYKIVGQIGRGGQGEVYHAIDTRIDREVALKFLRYSDSKLLERFIREPQFAASVEHRSICRIYDAGTIRGIHYITMELIEGETIQQRLENDGRLQPQQAASIAGHIASALSKVHAAGIVHRDIKSGNIMIDEEGIPVLVDFGLARADTHSEGLTTTESFGGTLAFMSPEQAAGHVPDYRSDIYSLGAVLYHMLTGEVPFGLMPAEFYKQIGKSPPPSPRKLRSDLDADLDTICRKAMAIRPEDRYPSADEMADAVQRFIEGRPQIAKLPRSRRWRWGVLAATLLLLAALVAAYTVRSLRDSDTAVGASQGPRQVDRWIETSGPVTSFAIDHKAERLYVAANPANKTYPIHEYEVASGREVGEPIPFGDLHQHTGLALSQDGRNLFATNFYFEYISRIDLSGARTPEPIRIIDADKEREKGWRWASGVALTADGTKAVIPMGTDERPDDPDAICNDQLAIVDVLSDPPKVLANVPLGDEPWGWGTYIPIDENAVYLTTSPRPLTDVPKVYRVGLEPPYAIRSLPIPNGRLMDVRVSSKLNRVFVADSANRQVWTVDRSRFGSAEATKFVELNQRAPCALALDERRNLLAVLCPDSRSLHILDAVNGCELARYEGLRRDCRRLLFSDDGRRLFATCGSFEGGVAVLRVPNFAVRIAFSSDRAGTTDQIYTMNVDGTDVKPLFESASHAHDREPCWSPDGRHIAFITDRKPKRKVCMATSDGTQLRLFEDSLPRDSDSVAWSPSGDRIAYIAASLVDLHVVDVETGSVSVLPCHLPSPFGEFGAICWESDTRLLVTARPIRNALLCEVFRVDAITGEAYPLTNEQDLESSCTTPRVSRDGRIAVLRDLVRDGPAAGIYLLREHKSQEEMFEKLTVHGPPVRFLQSYCWFPNGDKIAYSDLPPKSPFRHIFILDVATKTCRQLTSGAWNDRFPDVSPPLADAWLRAP